MSSLFFLCSSFLKLLAWAFLFISLYMFLASGEWKSYHVLGSILHGTGDCSGVCLGAIFVGPYFFPSSSLLDSATVLSALACRFPSWSHACCWEHLLWLLWSHCRVLPILQGGAAPQEWGMFSNGFQWVAVVCVKAWRSLNTKEISSLSRTNSTPISFALS